MNEFQVKWTDDGLSSLGECMKTSGRHPEVVTSTLEANRVLATEGNTSAVHMAEGLWFRDFDSLRVYFTIHESTREIQVVSVRLIA